MTERKLTDDPIRLDRRLQSAAIEQQSDCTVAQWDR